MNETHNTDLEARVKAVWRREQLLRFAEGALVFLRWGLLMFLAAGLVDWWIKIPAPGRVVMLLAVLGIPFYKAWHAGWKHLRPFNATRTALQIEENSGGMESLLVTALQLKDTTRRHGTSDALCDLTCRKAEESAEEIEPKEAVRFQSLRRPAVTALIVVLFFGILAATNGPLLVAGLGRIFAPWLTISYPTRTQLELVDGDLVVQEGKPVRIVARVSGVVPRKAKIALRTGKGKPRIRKLVIANGECEYMIETAFRGFEYRLSAGDARSPWHAVQVINSPNIEHAEVKLQFPEYTGRAAETVEALTFTVPETTKVDWTLTLDRAVREAAVNLAGQDPITMNISEDGLTVKFEQVASESLAYGFSWVEREHGFSFTSPNNYLQVAPDRPPRVELTSPKRNIYATLGRRLDLAFRGRDDHGIAQSVVAYRVDKTEEEKVSFTPENPIDGTEQKVNWDYRSVLTNIVVGQTVTFAVELADSYPGDKGPHRARSEARRVQFMSMADYLAQVEKQKKRLLSRLRTIYREERKVHEVVMRLDRSDPVFIQTCQLEAVRQDLVRERVDKLAGRMHDLTEDLAANSVTNKSLTASLVQLRSDLQRISASHISEAANALRALASESGEGNGSNGSAKAHAEHMVNSSARELGLLVLQLGFEDAADVMAREMHSAAQTQASLRLHTIMREGDKAELAAAQDRLGKWLSRLFAASPKERESTIDDALIEFTLTRLVKQMVNGGIDKRIEKAAALIREGGSGEAAKLQSGVVAVLLKAEFRLRVGAEREALAKAMTLFNLQSEAQEKLRLEITALDDKTFTERHAELAKAQAALHRNLQLLLMPAVPAGRIRLFDDVAPKPPPVAGLLGAVDDATTKAATHIEKGDREAAAKAQSEAESSFASLVDLTRKRIAAMTQAVRIDRMIYTAKETDERIGRFGERQVSLLEKTEDAEADETKSEYLADQQAALADAIDELGVEIANGIKNSVTPSENSLSLPVRINEASRMMRKAIPFLRENKPGKAIEHQVAAVSALTAAQALLAEHGQNIASYSALLSSTKEALVPSPYVGEIEEEQRDMLALTRKTKPDDMPALALPQRNLIHAVDAILVALDPVAHMVESGTVMLFAKADMDAAGEALASKDSIEALDAQEYIVETLEELRGQLELLGPQYLYLLEVVEALHETIQEGILVREAQRRLREKTSLAGADAAGLAEEQGALNARVEAYSKLINEVTGLEAFASSLVHMSEAERMLKSGDGGAATDEMAQVQENLVEDTSILLSLMELLGLVLRPPMPEEEFSGEVVLLKKVLVMASQQKNMYRDCYAGKPDTVKDYEPKLREFEKACGPFIEIAKEHKNPVLEDESETPKPIPPANLHLKLVAARDHLGKAAASCKASDRAKSLASQKKASESLRHFVCEYALKFVTVPGVAPGGDPAPNDVFNESEDMFELFMPGAVTGKKPPDGKLEWEVLGKRDRAALNENFARELPLEYRAILKNYYERLAR